VRDRFSVRAGKGPLVPAREHALGRRAGRARGRARRDLLRQRAEAFAPGMKKKKRSGPGRPEGESFAREKILKAAEIAFAEHGYAGTSLREIVKRAHVTQALVTYYFGSKDALFKEVFLRRGREIASKRIDALKALKKPFRLPDVVAAY